MARSTIQRYVIFILTVFFLTGSASTGWCADARAGVEAYYKKDYARALAIFTPLAQKGDVAAQLNLGIMYSKGEGVPKNHAIANKWLRLAAERGATPAQVALGAQYVYGNGMPKDYVQAYMWGAVAAAKGRKQGDNLKKFAAKSMTGAQISKAEALAQACLRKNFKGC